MGEPKGNSKASHFIPLSKGSYSDGPSTCLFSSPKVKYSKDTQEFVNMLMKESRLTTRQKSGFESILRTGSSLPRRSEDIMRNKQYFSHKHAAKGLAMGLDVRYPESEPCSMNSFRFLSMGTPSKRSLHQIKASGDLNHIQPRKYTPFDKEKEKERFANKMAFGKHPHEAFTHHDNTIDNYTTISSTSSSREVKEVYSARIDRLEELVGDIRDRVDFLKGMQKIGREKTYHSYIVCQIQQKLGEIHSLSPNRVTEVIDNLQLASVDKCFITGNIHTNNIFE